MSQLPVSLSLKVITSRRLLVDSDAEEVTLPSLDGSVGILPGHRPLFLALGRGILAYRLGRKEEKFAVKDGYAEVQAEAVLVFTELSEDEKKETSHR